jgi:Flp pilus assembly protein TadG
MNVASRAGKRSSKGQGLVEFALILPLLLLLLLGIIEFGIAVFRYNSIANIGREVARYGSVHPNSGDITDFINADNGYGGELQRWTTLIITDTGVFTITPTLLGTDFLSQTVQVTVTYDHEFITGPLIEALGGGGQLTMQTVTQMYVEFPHEEGSP